MKEELYLWIRNLAVFYIFFTAVLNLIPDQKYEKYVRFFMGLLLIFMMSTPIFSILGKGSELTESFLDNFSEENREKELREFQNIQKVYLEKGYELELEQKIRETLEKRGIEVYKVKVNIEGEETQANLVLKTEISQEERKELKDALVEEWGLKETEFVSRLSEMNPAKWGILLLIGVLLAVAAMPVSSKQQKKNTAGEQSEDMQKSVLEEKLEAFLENTEGVGKVQVILMTDEKKDRQSFYNSETIQVTGVLISAEGGGNPVVVQNIQEAVMALFQVDAHRIRIMKMK